MNLINRKTRRKAFVWMLVAAMLMSNILALAPITPAYAAPDEPVLVITGTGLEEDVIITETDWKNFNHPEMVERYFSSNNSSGFHKIWKVKGFDLFNLLDKGTLLGDEDYSITFVASDGFKRSWTISQLESLYHYPDFTLVSGELVNPLIGSYRKDTFDQLVNDENPLNPPVTWEDISLIEAEHYDINSPRLYLGQADGNIDDMNQSNFIRDLRRIVVGEERPVEPDPDDDFTDSPYKHISYDGAPYNIDAITGATMTIEGPGVESYRALSLRQIEEENAGQHRAGYMETIGGQSLTNSYEGIKVSYLLDEFVTLRDNLGNIVFRDKNRQKIAEFTLDEVRDEQRGMIVAYGVNEVPLVYTSTDAGYIPEKHNDDGCFKLVYHVPGGYDQAFSNVAYIYVEKNIRPGYEHDKPPYDDPRFTNYIFSLSGSGLGKEVNYTVADLEAMTDLHLEKEYSLSNSEHYWYYNTYKGVPLWDLLLASGLDPDIDENTPVNFVAADDYNFPPMTIGDLKDPDRWGYYEKDAADTGDDFDGSAIEPLDTGYPVLVAYGFNGYPYVIRGTDDGYNSGLRNAGGPLRIIFGKSDYEHTNGSHQVQYAKRVVIGEPVNHTTHNWDPYDDLAENPIDILIKGEEGNIVSEHNLTVADIEDMVYGGTARQRDDARVKTYYYTHNAGGGSIKISDLYEGISLSVLLFEKIGLPGTTGTVSFENAAGDKLTVNMEDILKNDYFNEVNGSTDIKPVLAFGKNGYPMVVAGGNSDEPDDPGYIGRPIFNRYGPLMALFGQTEVGTPGQQLRSVTRITVELQQDPWAHLLPPYDQYADDVLSISGTGVRSAHTVTVGALERMQGY
ncbi:MAG: hypothetical protein SCM88_12300, partial [Bacillota bacterium]|nr:hypothetical protein [Bacillota bacterium]